ncbi:uncharacterized protein isoform X2 [Musca autumnalis]|uniref:uncharacterized protein isoform X2 n=1 Tax=Musca autumnalis TaxID=221902 RepID=UPI003CF4E972
MTTEVVSENKQHLNVSNECTGSNDPASSAVAAPTTSDVISSEPEMTTEVVSENEQQQHHNVRVSADNPPACNAENTGHGGSSDEFEDDNFRGFTKKPSNFFENLKQQKRKQKKMEEAEK